MVTFIADIGSNHNKSLDRIADLIMWTAKLGCKAAKFQYFTPAQLYAAEFGHLQANISNIILPPEFVPEIQVMCRKAGIEFHITPFHSDDVPWLSHYVDAFKIASYSILDLKLIEACARIGKPLSISTGGATDSESEKAWFVACQYLPYDKITQYHCVPEYPAKVRAGMMSNMRLIGDAYSDHTRDHIAILAAVASGATKIEFHLDLDDIIGAESRHGHCWPASLAEHMISLVRRFDSVLYDSEEEQDYTEMRKWRNDPDDEARPVKQYRKELQDRDKSNLERICTEGIVEDSE